jgi:glycosyltransferase involved in cell wall biosynthesis
VADLLSLKMSAGSPVADVQSAAPPSATASQAAAGLHLLVIAHNFPPVSAIGTMRTLRLVRRLDVDGWSTTVLTATTGTYADGTPTDAALLERLPDGVEVVRAPVVRALQWLIAPLRRGSRAGVPARREAAETGSARRPSLLRRAYAVLDEITTIPDKEAGWIVPAVARGVLTVLRERPDALYSSSPPWSGQVVALALARVTGLPWIADFRDPWARAPWRETQPARIRRASVTLERHVVARADALLFATRANRDEYVAHYGERIAAKSHVVRNGCDPDEFTGLGDSPPRDGFVLLHAGSLYGARTPVPLFRAVARALGRGVLDRDRFRLRLIGSSGDGAFEAAARELGLEGVVEFLPRMARRDILREMAGASCLLVLQPVTTVSVPGKLYEYLAIGRRILSLSEEGETSDLVRESGLGIAVAPEDEAAIQAALLQLVADSPRPVRRPPAALYDGNATAAEAAAIIGRVVRAGRLRS